MRLRALRLGAAAMLLAGSATACRSHAPKTGEGRLTVDGETLVAIKGNGFRPAAKGRLLHPGDRVRVESGTAKIALADGGKLELRAGSALRFETVPFVEGGDVLAEPSHRPINLDTDGAGVRVADGAARLSRTLAVTLTSYRGTSTIDSAGFAPLAVRAPRQATLAVRGVLPDRALAVDYRADDSWDRRFLARPFAAGNDLDVAARGLFQQLPPGEGQTPGFFRLVLPALEAQPDLDHLLVPQVGADQNLIGAAIAVRGTIGSFSDRWKAVFDFRDPLGRRVNWGFVALDQGVDDPTVVGDDIDVAIGRAPKQFAAARAGVAEPQLPADTSPTRSGSGGSTTTPTTAPPTPTTTAPPQPPPTSPPPSPSPVPSPVPVPVPVLPEPPATGTPADQIVDPLVSSANGLLQSLSPPPPP